MVQSADLVVVGASAIDIISKPLPDDRPNLTPSTFPGTIRISCGGVGRNIAETSHRFFCGTSSGHRVLLLSPVGDDEFGNVLSRNCEKIGMRTDGLIFKTSRQSATCSVFLDSRGSLVGGIADMDIVKMLLPEEVSYGHLCCLLKS